MATILLLFYIYVNWLALLASTASAEFKRIFNLKRGNKGQLTLTQKNSKIAAILE